MGILNRYILRDLFYYFGVLLLAVTILFLGIEAYEARDEAFDERPNPADLMLYVALSVPGKVVDLLPMIAMFATLVGIGLLAKNREILAMAATGTPFSHMAKPVLLFGGVVMCFSFWLTEAVAPPARAHADYLYRIKIKKNNSVAYTSNDEIFRKGAGNRFYVMDSFDGVEKRMIRPSILDVNSEGGGLAQRIEADEAKYVSSPDGTKQFWEFRNAERWIFEPDGRVRIDRFEGNLKIEMEEKLDSFLAREKRPEAMRWLELKEYCDILRTQNDEVQLPRYRVTLHSKIAMPLASMMMALVGFAAAADLRKRSFVWTVSTGMTFAVAYYIFNEGMLRAGRSGGLEPAFGTAAALVAAWSPMTLFGSVAVGLLRRLSIVH